MYKRREKAKRDTDLCSGPAKLCEALQINLDQNGDDLVTSKRLFIEKIRRRALPASKVAVTPRIGIDYAEEWADKPLRFFVQDNPHISR